MNGGSGDPWGSTAAVDACKRQEPKAMKVKSIIVIFAICSETRSDIKVVQDYEHEEIEMEK